MYKIFGLFAILIFIEKQNYMKVIILNGPMGVGKTAVGKYIAEATPGTAFIDGDWCLDIHPFIGNHETKTMAVANILHMIGNYKRCIKSLRHFMSILVDATNY